MPSPFRPFIDASPEPAWVVDSEGRIVEANAAAVQLFGRPLVDGLVMPELAEATLRACEAASAIHWTERCETRQGLRALGGWMAPWREGESPRGCLCVARDLTAVRVVDLAKAEGARPPRERVEPKKSPAPAALLPVAPRLRVLAAEDNATNRKVISRLLEKLGVEVETVDDGLRAVARLVSGERPHLVLMDCHMPGLDGTEATAQLRVHEAQHGLARLPIVALTASAYEEDKQRCLDAGMDDFLAKPVNLEALRGVLERWAQRS